MKKIFLMLILAQAAFQLVSCDERKKLEISILDDTISQTLIFTITNYADERYYISKNSWLRENGDTLFVDAVYSPRTDSSLKVLFNQFIPPEMDVLNPKSKMLKRLPYKDLKVRIGNISSVRIFTALNPYDPESNHIKYHSIDEFYEFQKKNSFVLVEKIEKIDRSNNW